MKKAKKNQSMKKKTCFVEFLMDEYFIVSKMKGAKHN